VTRRSSNESRAERDTHVDLLALYKAGLRLYRSGGLPPGASTGWSTLDRYYTVGRGQWTVVTGMPGSGKSEFLDALLVNLAERDDWLFPVYSPENWPPEEHLIKLVEKRVRKPFNAGPTPRMTEQEYANGAAWVLERFVWLDTEMKTPDELIAAALTYGSGRKLGVVLDPWNTLEHQRAGMSETDYVSFILAEVTKLARAANAHVWLVVHPAKIPRNKDGTRPVPTPYDISGSAHWYNKPDSILTVHRNQASGSQDVEIHVQKVRFKRLGHPGMTILKYDKTTGRYFDHDGPTIEGEFYADPERGAAPPELSEAEREAKAERAGIQHESLLELHT
jgi:twinkle protein